MYLERTWWTSVGRIGIVGHPGKQAILRAWWFVVIVLPYKTISVISGRRRKKTGGERGGLRGKEEKGRMSPSSHLGKEAPYRVG
jgi:hypothetical protein